MYSKKTGGLKVNWDGLMEFLIAAEDDDELPTENEIKAVEEAREERKTDVKTISHAEMKTRFEKKLDQTEDLLVTVMATSKMPAVNK